MMDCIKQRRSNCAEQKIRAPLEVMLAAAVCIFLILLGRMAYLQLYKGDYYGNQADGNRLRRTKITAPRGLFLIIKGRN